jgi:hypothetical protein
MLTPQVTDILKETKDTFSKSEETNLVAAEISSEKIH